MAYNQGPLPSLRANVVQETGYKTIKLYKDQSLGVGSYGMVCKAKCDELECAAKIIHQTLYDPASLQQSGPESMRSPFTRFVRECDFMKALRHPNIVQYLGIAQDPETRLPVLLMELMDTSLTKYLETLSHPVPYHMQINFGHDIARALAFLHSNGIYHRDLSSNNVLLLGDVRAKVTDFGMSTLSDVNPRPQQVSFTMCPGTDVYMPPEAVQDRPVYSEKIDSFSFGVILIQIMTRKFPDPKDRRKIVDLPQLQYATVEVRVPEVERRQNHINKVEPDHPILKIALDCIKDKEDERPSTQMLCLRFEGLKKATKYTESKAQAHKHLRNGVETHQHNGTNGTVGAEHRTIHNGTHHHNGNHNGTNGFTVGEGGADEIQHLKEKIIKQARECGERISERDKVIEEKEREIQQANQRVQSSERMIAEFQNRVLELERQLHTTKEKEATPEKPVSPRDIQQFSPISSPTEKTVPQAQAELRKPPLTRKQEMGGKPRLRSRHAQNAPCTMIRGTTATDGSKVYFNPNDSTQVYAYYPKSDKWRRLTDCYYKDSSLVTVKGHLTTVGGLQGSGDSTDMLLTYDRGSEGWNEVYPHMPKKRRKATVVCTDWALIVAGGLFHSETSAVNTVEIMNINYLQWSTAVSLPEPLYNATAAVCHDRIYVLGQSPASKTVYSCSIEKLLQSCEPKFRGNVPKSEAASTEKGWKKIKDLSFRLSTCVVRKDRLFAVGGFDDSFTPTKYVQMYNPATDSWEAIGQILSERDSCFAAVLPNEDLMIVGGSEGPYFCKDSVEIVSVS